MNISPVRTSKAVTTAWRAFFTSLGVDIQEDGIAWPHWRLTGLGDGGLTVRWRIARAELKRPLTLAHETWEASQQTRGADLIVLVDRPPALPILLGDDPHRPGEPIRENANAYTFHVANNAMMNAAYFWTDCPGCGGLVWRVNGWAGGCPKDEPDGDEFVYAHSSPRLLVAYLAAETALAAIVDTA